MSQPEWRWDRYHRRWVVISPRRALRPGGVQPADLSDSGVDNCPFCPGHEERTPPEVFRTVDSAGQWQMRVVPNLYGMVQSSEPPGTPDDDPCPESAPDSPHRSHYRYPAEGTAEIIIETPDHKSQLTDLSAGRVALLFQTCAQRVRHLRSQGLPYACLFKNYGREAGASLAHSHSQLIALPFVPPEVLRWHTAGDAQQETRSDCLLCSPVETAHPADYPVLTLGDWDAFVPWAAASPFEVWISPRTHPTDFARLSDPALDALGDLVHRLLRALSILIGDIPYNLIFHAFAHPPVHWHLEIIPRITRIAGFELATGSFVNPVDPAAAARRLRAALDS